jgi:Cys-tRNA(Pro)/Cys-tRNA(Cys) deacylase
MDFRNNVTRLLESRKVAYKLHLYDYDAGIESAVQVAAAIGLPPERVIASVVGREAAAKVAAAIGLPPERVFKTLVTLPDPPGRKPMLVVIPGPATLDLKALAKATGHKKVKMALHKEAEALTGLQTGGISPLALIGKGFDIYLAEQAIAHDTIAVSAGQRGANVELSVKDLIKLTNARVVQLSDGA